MIQRKDILSIPYMKKSAFTGSYQGMRYRLKKENAEEADVLRVDIWEAPYAYDVTPEEQKENKEFPFSEEGICQAVEWLNDSWQQQEERWKKSINNCYIVK